MPGPLIDHVHIVTRDIAASRRFYAAVLGALGHRIGAEGDGWFECGDLFVSDRGRDGLLRPSIIHLAFRATGIEEIRAFHTVALANGGTDNGPPGRRGYHPGYHAAFAFDPDGNNIEAVWHDR